MGNYDIKEINTNLLTWTQEVKYNKIGTHKYDDLALGALV